MKEADGFPAGAVSVNLDEGPGLVATQTRAFLFADIEGSVKMVQPRGDAYAKVADSDRRLMRAGLAGHGG